MDSKKPSYYTPNQHALVADMLSGTTSGSPIWAVDLTHYQVALGELTSVLGSNRYATYQLLQHFADEGGYFFEIFETRPIRILTIERRFEYEPEAAEPLLVGPEAPVRRKALPGLS